MRRIHYPKHRFPPVRHRVRAHIRRSPKGKKVYVHSYWRGSREPTPVTPKIIPAALRLHRLRSLVARRVDEASAAKLARDFEEWKRHPDRYDIRGVDYPTLENSLFRDIRRGKIKAPFDDEESFRQFLIKHGFTPEEARKIRLVVKASSPLGVWASAGKGIGGYTLQLALDKIRRKGVIEESVILHELGHIKDMMNPKIRSDWFERDLTKRIEETKHKNPFFDQYSRWADLSSWEIGQPYYDKDEELIVNSFAAYHTGELDEAIRRIDKQIERERKVLREYEEKLKSLPNEISPVTGKPYSLRGKRARAIRRIIRSQKEGIKMLKEVKKVNMMVKSFWRKRTR